MGIEAWLLHCQLHCLYRHLLVYISRLYGCLAHAHSWRRAMLVILIEKPFCIWQFVNCCYCCWFYCCVILRVNRSDLLRLLAAVSLNPPHLSAYHKTYTHTYAYINCVCVCVRVCRYVSKLFICSYPRIVMLNSTCASSDFTILPLSGMICAKTKKKKPRIMKWYEIVCLPSVYALSAVGSDSFEAGKMEKKTFRHRYFNSCFHINANAQQFSCNLKSHLMLYLTHTQKQAHIHLNFCF